MTSRLPRRSLLKAALAGAGVVGAGAWQEEPLPQAWIPGHVESRHPLWDTLYRARVSIDETHGVMRAAFTEAIERLGGSEVSVSGFILPIAASRRFTHFILTRRNASCPFCAPNEPTEAVEVFSRAEVEFRPEEFVASGRFEILAASSEGLFYRLRDTEVRMAS